jgi:rhamnulokinase
VLKNIAGLWLIQECRRVWRLEGRGEMNWDEMAQLATGAKPFVSLVDPDAPEFLAPSHMPDAIRQFCRGTGQVVPESEGSVIRGVLESLALRYRMVLDWIEQLSHSAIATIHIVGGGARNRLLCQMAADACNRRVVAGPVEATAIGNVMMQAVANGDVQSIAQARQVIRQSFDVVEYTPHNVAAWHGAYERFSNLVNK